MGSVVGTLKSNIYVVRKMTFMYVGDVLVPNFILSRFGQKVTSKVVSMTICVFVVNTSVSNSIQSSFFAPIFVCSSIIRLVLLPPS